MTNRLCLECIDNTIKDCLYCSIGQDLMQSSKKKDCNKSIQRSKKLSSYDYYDINDRLCYEDELQLIFT